MINYFENNKNDILKVIIICTSLGNVWLKQKEMLLYLVSNIKINQNKISRHILSNAKILEKYESIDKTNPIELLLDPVTLIGRFHLGSVNLYGHDINKCQCNNRLKKLPKGDRVFIYIKRNNNMENVYVYSKQILSPLATFDQVHEPGRILSIRGVANELEKCLEKITI